MNLSLLVGIVDKMSEGFEKIVIKEDEDQTPINENTLKQESENKKQEKEFEEEFEEELKNLSSQIEQDNKTEENNDEKLEEKETTDNNNDNNQEEEHDLFEEKKDFPRSQELKQEGNKYFKEKKFDEV